ncbi:DedA family protein [Arsenicitalea aurantiaca]|uniref:DedA family protein n=1 Tax=Arsenicitalea aurantiaca TaxID=1783274 RepID=A0A433X5Q1_9HYPH|nr:DedA family protein [Arsenicitalea aurantiaca]RUT29371.1 DedA family protein [Arsenicitalea aurantiaca]
MSDWIIGVIGEFGYLGLFLLMLLESVFPPIPSELIIPFAGFSAARGELSYLGVLAATTMGAVTGMLPWYFAGRIFGLARVRHLADRFGRWFTLNADEIDMATNWFVRHGPMIILFGRLIPIIRTLISVPAGLARLPLPLFLLASGAGALVWNVLLVSSGFILNEHYHAIEAFLDPLTLIVLCAVLGLYIYRLITWRPSKG